MAIDFTGELRRQQALKAAQAWAKTQRQRALLNITKLGIRQRGELYKSVRSRIKRKSGEVESIVYSFARQGIFSQIGVGRGTKVTDVGSTNRKAKPWITETFTQASIDELADQLTAILGDDALDQINFNSFQNLQ